MAKEHYNPQGKPCHCPWGGGKHHQEHLGAIKEASKLEWLEGRPDFQEDHPDYKRNQFWLEHVKESGIDKADKLLPWLHREFKKGRLLPGGDHLRYKAHGSPWDDNEIHTPQGESKPWIAQGMNLTGSHRLKPEDIHEMQTSLEEMSKRKQGVDVMQHKVHELMPKVKDFQDWKAAQERMDLGEPLHHFDNGWSVRRLQDEDEHEDEGNLMGHCIGGQEYKGQTHNGDRIFASLRDEKNLPHATMELYPDHWEHKETGEIARNNPYRVSSDPNKYMPNQWVPQVGPRSSIEQFYGKEDSAPLQRYTDQMNDWLTQVGGPEATTQGGIINVPGAWDVPDYNWQKHQDFDPMVHADDNYHLDPDGIEEPEVEFEDPEWGRIANSYLELPDQFGDSRGIHLYPEERKDFFNNVRENYHTAPFENELYANADPENPRHQQLLQQWEQWKQPYYHPYTGEYVQGYNTQPPMEQFQQRLFNEKPKQEYSPWPGGYATGPYQGPENERYLYNTAAAGQPMYYRWIYAPSTGEVTLGSNADDHPARVKYHGELGGQADSANPTHGYAYRIGNGWRLTDWEHKAVEDPYTVSQVVRALERKESPEIVSQGSWREDNQDWDRLHYSQPISR